MTGLAFLPPPQTHRLEAMSECLGVVDGEQASMIKDKNLHNEKPQRLESQVSSFVSHSSFPPLPKASFSLLSPFLVVSSRTQTFFPSSLPLAGSWLIKKQLRQAVLFCFVFGGGGVIVLEGMPSQPKGRPPFPQATNFKLQVNNPVVKPIQLRLQPASLPNKIEEKYLSAL